MKTLSTVRNWEEAGENLMYEDKNGTGIDGTIWNGILLPYTNQFDTTEIGK